MTDRGKLVAAVIGGLKTLANYKFDTSAEFGTISATGEDLLFALYKAGVSGIKYTPEEKQIIGPLVPPALEALSYRLSNLHNNFSANSLDSTKIERSGLQFLLDDFKELSINIDEESQRLEEIIQDFLDREDIEELDERIQKSEHDYYKDDGVRSTNFQAEITKLPATHWWFQD